MPLVRGLDLLAFSNVGESGLTAVHPNDGSVGYLHGSSKEPEWAVGYLERARAGVDVLHGTLELVRRRSFPGCDGHGRRYWCGRWPCLLHLSKCWNSNECHAQHDAGSHASGARNRTTKQTIHLILLCHSRFRTPSLRAKPVPGVAWSTTPGRGIIWLEVIASCFESSAS